MFKEACCILEQHVVGQRELHLERFKAFRPVQVYTAKSVATSWNFRSSGASFYVLWCSVVAPRIVPQLFTSITYLPLLDLDQFRCKPSCKSVWTAVASTLETLWMWMVSAWIWGRSWGECYFSVFVDAICSVMSLWLMQRLWRLLHRARAS